MSELKQSLEQSRTLRPLFERRAALLQELAALDHEIDAIQGDYSASGPEEQGRQQDTTARQEKEVQDE